MCGDDSVDTHGQADALDEWRLAVDEYSGEQDTRVVDQVVVEHGTLPAKEVFHGLRAGSANNGDLDPAALVDGRSQPGLDAGGYALYRIGDALASRNIHAAIYDALRLCRVL